MKDMRPETPFPKHWLYYIVLKLAILALAVWLALKSQGLV
jgi:hypothetical protein